MSEENVYPDLYYFTKAYLHQDFDVNGEDIPGILRNNYRGHISEMEGLRNDAMLMSSSTMTDAELEYLLSDEWRFSIEPSPEDGEDWRYLLRQIIDTIDEMQNQATDS